MRAAGGVNLLKAVRVKYWWRIPSFKQLTIRPAALYMQSSHDKLIGYYS